MIKKHQMKHINHIDKLPRLGTWSDVWHNIRRSPYQTLIALLMLMFTFYTVTIFALIAMGTHEVIQFMEAKPQVSAFFKEPPSSDQLAELRLQLEAIGPIKDFRYISQDEAYKIYKDQNQDDPILLEMVVANILPTSVEVSANNPGDLEKMAQSLQSNELVDDLIYPKQVVDEFVKWTTSIRTLGMENAIFLGVLSFLLIFVIMGIKVAMHKREINILLLVGATPWYVRRPFVLEALFYGFWGAVLGWGAAYTRLLYATPFLVHLFKPLGGLPEAFSPMMMVLLLGIEVGMALIGAILATTLAVSRFLSRH